MPSWVSKTVGFLNVEVQLQLNMNAQSNTAGKAATAVAQLVKHCNTYYTATHWLIQFPVAACCLYFHFMFYYLDKQVLNLLSFAKKE